MRTVAIVQARMGSTRLPGKALREISGEPMLVRVVERTRRARSLDRVMVATTTEPADDAIAGLCAQRGYACFRGSQEDVLDRYYRAAHSTGADAVVRITGDCPLIDPDVIDLVIAKFTQTGADFAANRLPPPWHRTYPIGLDVEVCTLQALERAWREADQALEREHVMPYLYMREGRFRTVILNTEPDYGGMRWAVDTPEDLEFVRQVYARMAPSVDFTWGEVIALLEREPGLRDINKGVSQKSVSDP